MNSYYQLPAGPSPQPTQPTAVSRVGRLLLLWLIAALCLGGYKYISVRSKPPAESRQVALPQIPPDHNLDDRIQHIDDGVSYEMQAAEEVQRAEHLIVTVLPPIQRSYLPREHARLEGAVASLETARQDIERIRSNLEILRQSLLEGR
jgi:hypothetical protein